MKIILKSLNIENFKGIKRKSIVFADKTEITGANATGKTSIFDAFTWLLFNKNGVGEEKFNIRPLDAAGNRIDNVEIKVVAVMEVDGKEVELLKVQRQNWVKHRNSSAPTLEGNVNSFEIDGYPKSEKDYKAYISSLVAEDLFKMLTNPQYFVSMKWKDQRDILMKFVSDVSDVELARQFNIVDDADTHQFDNIIPELEKAPSTDDIAKKYNKALREWKKKQTEIPVRIDELSKSLVDIDVAEQELAKTDLERKIAEAEKKISDAGSAVGDLMSEEMQLQFDMSGIMQTMNRGLADKRSELSLCVHDEGNKAHTANMRAEQIAKDIEKAKSEISSLEAKKPEINEKYKENQQRVFDEAPYLFDESKWVFDETETVCKCCGQVLPQHDVEQKIELFEIRKANAKADCESKMKTARETFLADKERVRNELLAEADTIKKRISDLTVENDKLQKQITDLQEQEKQANERKAELEKQLVELPEEADYTQDLEYAKLKARHDEVLAEIAKTNSTGYDELIAGFNEEKADLQEELDKVKAEIAKASKNVEIEERIGELEAEKREVSQKVADQEKMLYLLEQFIKAKMLKISESINSKFKTVRWKLFETQLNGGLKECCECTVNGVPFSTLNSGHRIVSGLDIINSLSELYGVEAPIFIDNAESLNVFNIPIMDCQMILLKVADPIYEYEYEDKDGFIPKKDESGQPIISKVVYDGSLKVEVKK